MSTLATVKMEIDGGGVKSAADEDDTMPLADLAKKIALANFRANQAEKRKQAKEKADKASRKKARTDNHKAEAKVVKAEAKSESEECEAESEPKKKNVRASGGRRSAASASGKGKYADFYETSKGRLVQALLCRWHYAMEWPDKSSLVQPKPDYECLDGDLSSNIWVCTGAEEMGNMIDLRHNSDDGESYCPCLANFARLTSEKLCQLLGRAYDNQITLLKRDSSGHDDDDDAKRYGTEVAALIQTLQSQKRWVNELDVEVADGECSNQFSDMICQFALEGPIRMPGSSNKTILKWNNVKLKPLL